MRRFFIKGRPHTGSICKIDGPDARHIKAVLRMAPGEEIWLFDGRGMEYQGVIRSIQRDSVDVEIVSAFECRDLSGPEITVAQAMLKDKKMDTLVRQLTELGIRRWVPVVTRRSIPRPGGDRIRSRMERWRSIAAESLKQCGRGFFPEISEPIAFGEAVDLCREHDISIIFTSRDEKPLERPPGMAKGENVKVMVMLGPEGGFTEQETAVALEKGFVAAGLGRRILKADTATVAAAAIVQHLFGDM